MLSIALLGNISRSINTLGFHLEISQKLTNLPYVISLFPCNKYHHKCVREVERLGSIGFSDFIT